MKKLTLILSLLIFSGLLSPVAVGLDNDVDAAAHPLNKWQFFQTLERDITTQTISESDWKNVSLQEQLTIDAGKGIYGWYKTTFDTTNIASTNNLNIYIDTLYGADETYLNGKKIGGLGELHKEWDFFLNNPQAMPRNYVIPQALLKETNNEIWIKVNLGYGAITGFNYFGGTGIANEKVFLTPSVNSGEVAHKRILFNSILDIIIVCFAIFEAFVILLGLRGAFHYFPEFPWLLISVVLMIGSTLVQDTFFIYGMRNLFVNSLAMLAVGYSSLILAMYFWSQFRNVPAWLAYTTCGFFSVLVILLLSPILPVALKNPVAVIWQWSGFILNIYALVTLLYGVKQTHTGALVTLIGLIGYGLSIRSDTLGINLANQHDILIGSLVFRYALIIAYFQRIKEISHNYQSLSKELVNTIEHHREEVARELHDDMGQRLAIVKLQLNLMTEETREQKTQLMLREIKGAISSMRRIVQGLHPIGLDTQNLSTSIRTESEHISHTYGAKFVVTTDEIPLEKNIEVQLMRIFQEATLNAIRHGNASEIKVNLTKHFNGLILEIADNGKGFTSAKQSANNNGGFGMISMSQRAEQINATLEVRSTDNQGTSVKVLLAQR